MGKKKAESAPVLESTEPVAAPPPPTLLDAAALFENYAFETPLPLPTRIDTANRPFLKMQMRETEQFLGLYDADGNPLMTTVWGYGTSASNTSYPGPTIVAYEDQPLRVFWQNHLPTDGHLLPVDMTLHMAHPMMRSLHDGFIPVVPHLHGGHTGSGSDGLPDAWFTQAGGKGGKGPAEVGPGYGGKIFNYANDQEAAPLWYHDHALGLTRLNVYAGLAGFYLLEDEQKQALRTNVDGLSTLPSLDNSIELAIQDRAFTADGQLYYP
ncbi:MAG TPA: hypothetical protein VFV47_05145, partial [Hyphomicrobiaceae bacterium]|nr:hypothetical protein [Hyphomicrobiaceae bacterium]